MSDIADNAQAATELVLAGALARGVKFSMKEKPDRCRVCKELPMFAPASGSRRETLGCSCKRTSAQTSRQGLTKEWNYINQWR